MLCLALVSLPFVLPPELRICCGELSIVRQNTLCRKQPLNERVYRETQADAVHVSTERAACCSELAALINGLHDTRPVSSVRTFISL